MPHDRNRHVLALIEQKLSLAPVVAIQGARQTGKSFIGQILLTQKLRAASYISLDEKALRVAAQNSPDDFLLRYPDARPLIIDEVQKAPDLFDALKLNVDRKRVPGKFLILGSTEFSRLSHIRESLTGRMSRTRVFPFNIAESLSLPINTAPARHLLNSTPRASREDLHRYLQNGGLPGVFAVRSSLERDQILSDILDLIVFRDARFVKSFDPELGKDILSQIAQLDFPQLSELSAKLKRDSRIIKKHVEVLQELFVLNRVDPHISSTGKSLYYLYDCALAAFLGASHRRVLQTWFLNEQLSQRSSQGQLKWKVLYYSNAKSKMIDFVLQTEGHICAVRILEDAAVRKTDGLLMTHFVEKLGDSLPCSKVILGPYPHSFQENGIEYFPYESVV